MIGALKPLIDAIPVSAMREANAKTAGGMSVEETARRLEKQIKRE
jgi:co-chaperonin GroES (HSP10)